jgi:hypothetical protein
MAVTDYPGGDPSNYPDWLQALLGNQAYGGTPPGGSAQGYAASSGQQANMGYPAVPGMSNVSGAAAAQRGQPAAPPLFQFGGFHPGNILNPDIYHDAAVTRQKLGGILNAATQGQPTNSQDLIGGPPPTFPSLNLPPAALSAAPGDTGGYMPSVPGPLASGGGYGSVPPSGWGPQPGAGAGPGRSPTGPGGVNPVVTANVPRPGAGAGPGRSPSGPAAVSPAAAASVPPAASAPSRFTMVDRPNMSATGWNPGAPQMTALNLAGLFGGGQPQAAAPAVAPNATARVRGPLASPTTGQPMPMSWADAAYGVPDARGAPYPYALGSPRSKRSGYQ